jgi:hypothetical protein
MTSNNSPLSAGFEPAVPLPVIAPSDEEQPVVRMNERYSNSAAGARLVAIEKQASNRESYSLAAEKPFGVTCGR